MRLYDPTLGRFLQADPIIQAPGNAQSHNRYAYVMNNPLSFPDPSGFSAWTKWRSSVFAAAVWAAVAIVTEARQGEHAVPTRLLRRYLLNLEERRLDDFQTTYSFRVIPTQMIHTLA